MTFAFNPASVIAEDTAGFPSSDLGSVTWDGDKAYRLVKAAAEIAAAAGKVLVTAYASGVPTWAVNTTTSAGNVNVAGIVPQGIGTIPAGAFFYVQCSGPVVAVMSTDGAVGGSASTSTTAGRVLITGATAGVIGVGTLAAAEAGANGRLLLKGLL